MKKKPTLGQALFPILFMIVALSVGYGYFGFKTEPILVASAFVAGITALKLGYTWKEMEGAIVEKITKAMPATLVLWSVGFLIGSWMFSGTVPMIIYYGVQIVNPKFFRYEYKLLFLDINIFTPLKRKLIIFPKA